MSQYAVPQLAGLTTSGAQERSFLMKTLRKLKTTGGYDRFIEPCAGLMALSQAANHVGYDPHRFEMSDVTMAFVAAGYAATGQDVAELDVRIDDQPIVMTGDPIVDAAEVWFEFYLARTKYQAVNEYWESLLRDLEGRRTAHVEELRKGLVGLQSKLLGSKYLPLDCLDHMRRVKDDPKAVIILHPPAYTGGFEKATNTGGRVTWKQPNYEVWDIEKSPKALAEEAQDWKAMLIVGEQVKPGEEGCPEGVMYVREASEKARLYIWSNRPDECKQGAKTVAVPRGAADFEKPTWKYLPKDHRIMRESKIEFGPVSSPQYRYLRDLFLHRIKGGEPGQSLGVFVDGFFVGVIGYDIQTICRPYNNHWDDAAILVSCLAPPHPQRTGRLLGHVALNREAIRYCMKPWIEVQVKQLVTAEFTRYDEAKGQRGIMKLQNRSYDTKRKQNKLIYAAPIEEKPLQVSLDRWLKQERNWIKSSPKASVAA